MDEILSADILAVCNTLGYADGLQYYPDPQCLDSGKDLVLYLRRDTPQHDVRRLLGEAQVLQKDLVPIFKMEKCGDDLSEVILRLMVNLTNPPLLLYEHGISKKSTRDQNNSITITHHLQLYKAAFTDQKFWTVVFVKLKKLIGDMDVLLENQKLTVERILILIRNILQVPADPKEEMRNDDDASVHDQVLWTLHSSGIMDLLLFIASSDTTQEFYMHVLEIITLVVREHSGEQLAKTQTIRTEEEKSEDVNALTQTLLQESVMKSRKRMSGRSFGGTFVVRGLHAPSGHEQICHKPVHSVAELSQDNMKKTRKTPVNRREFVEPNNARRSTLKVRLFLKEFCVEFLSRAYNNLMKTVKGHLERGGQDNDESYYLRAMRFFMEFNRFHKFSLELVSQTLNKSTFHYVHGLVDRFHDLMTTDKDNVLLWGKRAHTAFRAYQELLSSLHEMERTSAYREQAQAIASSIFYLPEYRELCVGLLSSFESGKLSRNYLCDLVDTNHLFLKMLENFSRERTVIVADKKRIKRRRSTKTKKKSDSRKKNKRMKNTEESWTNLEDKLTEFLSGAFELEQAIPFDAASDTPIDEQKVSALNRIATHVSLEEFTKAVSLLRAAKEVWPDDNQLSMETEISSLKSIFLQATLLPEPETPPPPPADEEDEEEGGGKDGLDDEENEYDEGNDEMETRTYVNESEFDFRGFLEKYAVVKTVANIAGLFKHFDEISPLTLHAILKMFHRYAFDMGYPAMLAQASIFHTFQRILKAASFQPKLKEAEKFILHYWDKFVRLAESNPKIFLEILFWKNSREAQEIQEGYVQYGENHSTSAGSKKKGKNSRNILTFDEENEITVLAEEYNAMADKPMKQVSWINERLLGGPRVKKVLTTFLTEKGLLFQGKIARKKKNVVVKLKPYAPSEGRSSDGEKSKNGNDSSDSEKSDSDNESTSTRPKSRNGQREESSDDDALVEELFAGLRKKSGDAVLVERPENNNSSGNGLKVMFMSSSSSSGSDSDSDSNEEKDKEVATSTHKQQRKRIIVHDDSSDESESESKKDSATEDSPVSNKLNLNSKPLTTDEVAQMLDDDVEPEISLETDATNGNASPPEVAAVDAAEKVNGNGSPTAETMDIDDEDDEAKPKNIKKKVRMISSDSDSD